MYLYLYWLVWACMYVVVVNLCAFYVLADLVLKDRNYNCELFGFLRLLKIWHGMVFFLVSTLFLNPPKTL